MPTLTDDERRRIRAEAEAMLEQVRAVRAGEPTATRIPPAIERTGLTEGTCKNAVMVCRAIERSRRRDFLSFAHHQEVAALPRPRVLDGQLVPPCRQARRTLPPAAKSLGEREYGDTYTAAIERTGLTYETVRACGWVAERVETVRRRTVLSWSHHREVAALPPGEREYGDTLTAF